jgi:hypothetical protein
MTAGVTGVPIEALATLRRRLAALPGRHPQRKALLSSIARRKAASRGIGFSLLAPNRTRPNAYFNKGARSEGVGTSICGVRSWRTA